jgi:tetratricopeptide (TPR) repeat protein
MRRFTLRPADALTELLSAHADLLAAGLDASAAHVNVERGMVQITLLDLPAARTRFTAAAAVHERAGDLRGHAIALTVLAQTYLRERRPADALPYLRRAVALIEQLGDRHLLATVTAHLGLAELPTCGPARRARHTGLGARSGREELADVEIVGLARLGIGEAQLQLGDPRSAAAEFAAARDRFAQTEAGYWCARAQEGLGLVAAAEGTADQARDLLTRAVQLASRFEPWRGDRIRATLAALSR